MNDLERYVAHNRGRLIHKWRHYFEVYERHLARYRGRPVQVVEIGVSHGGSLQMWRHYFGAQARVVGVDIDPACRQLAEPGIEIVIGDQSDRAFLASLATLVPRLDILIDDGGHTMAQQLATFEVLYPHVAADGVYVCEDLHTSYRRDWGGGYRHPGSFVERVKGLVDDLHGWHSEAPDIFGPTDFTRSADSLHLYDSLLVIEKRRRTPPERVHSGFPSFGEGARQGRSAWDRIVEPLARVVDRVRGR